MKGTEQPAGHGRVERAALYLRVSTEEQSTANQMPELEQLAAARRLRVVAVYEEQASAARKRPQFEQMMADAHRGRFDVLIVWALDRLGRSTLGNMSAVLELERRGARVVSVREPWLDTGGPVRDLLLAIFSWVAEQERARLIERTKAGLDRARRRGIRLGRPAARVDSIVHAQELVEVHGYREAARRLRVGVGSLHRMVKVTTEGGPRR